MLCSIADYNIAFKNPSENFQKFLQDYKTTAPAEVEFSINEQDIQKIRENVNYNAGPLQLEVTAFYDKLLAWLPLNNAMFLHASLIEVNNTGVAFTALSGTGKSTHTGLWLKAFPDAQIINDDKPAIRAQDDGVMVYGTPWSGKTALNLNLCVPLGGICFLERSETNFIHEISVPEAIPLMLEQTIRPKRPENVERFISVMDSIYSNVKVYRM
ncbi:MAG: hypothetical protein E7537_05645, partial [Ruminococcaceae bacterium]|nr:hypothetical protein [Oscillospiraceae bacterium]